MCIYGTGITRLSIVQGCMCPVGVLLHTGPYHIICLTQTTLTPHHQGCYTRDKSVDIDVRHLTWCQRAWVRGGRVPSSRLGGRSRRLIRWGFVLLLTYSYHVVVNWIHIADVADDPSDASPW
jgi:hypothetical protein